MCRVLDVSPSGYYAWLVRPASARARRDGELLERILAIHTDSRGTYGAPRVQAELRAQGVFVSRKRVARLMRQAGVRGVSRRRFVATTVRDERSVPAPDLVQRDFEVAGPNQLWVADITYIPTWAGFLYLAVVLDAWSRRVVGWAMATRSHGAGARRAGDGRAAAPAARRHPPLGPGVPVHVDRVRQAVRRGGSKAIDGSVGDAYDNAMCESFFATLECELLARRRFATQAEARTAVFDFIEGFYNPRRRHSALGYLSPIEYERRAPEGGLRACDFVISDIQWANADDLLCPIHDATGSTCASRTPGGRAGPRACRRASRRCTSTHAARSDP